MRYEYTFIHNIFICQFTLSRYVEKNPKFQTKNTPTPKYMEFEFLMKRKDDGELMTESIHLYRTNSVLYRTIVSASVSDKVAELCLRTKVASRKFSQKLTGIGIGPFPASVRFVLSDNFFRRPKFFSFLILKKIRDLWL
jgi:hypothetical protein